jgi:RsiW-degrading membrane proteinase PrsW (M82 family)
VARRFVFRWRHFDEPIDGLVYASAVAIGFATLENLIYLPWLGWVEQAARSLTSPLMHSLFAAIWGFGAGRAAFRARTPAARFAWQAIPLATSMLIHGLYDFLVIGLHATLPASGVVLVLWLLMIARARRLVREKGTDPSSRPSRK